MASPDNKTKAMEEIEQWFEEQSFAGPSNEGSKWLQDGRDTGEFSDRDLIEAGLHINRKMKTAVSDNYQLRKQVNEDEPRSPQSIVKHMAGIESDDIETTLEMINEVNQNPEYYIANPRYLQAIALLAKVYHRVIEENQTFQEEYIAMMKTQAWFEHHDRSQDRIGRNAHYTAGSPNLYSSRVLKQLAFYGKVQVALKLAQFNIVANQAQTEFPGRIHIPDLINMSDVHPRPNPDLCMSTKDQINAYDLSPLEASDSEDQKQEKVRQRRNSVVSLAILAGQMHTINDAAMEVSQSIHNMKSNLDEVV